MIKINLFDIHSIWGLAPDVTGFTGRELRRKSNLLSKEKNGEKPRMIYRSFPSFTGLQTVKRLTRIRWQLFHIQILKC